MSHTKSNAGGPTDFINQAGLKQLLNYKYVSGQYSFGDTLMTPFWNWVVTLWPLWVAPNLITLLGLVGNLIPVIIMLSYDTTFKEEMPKWVCVLGAIALFVYQTFDAIDGKQARRTGTSGPLGQLFDHGCDAMTTTISGLVLFQGLMLGREADMHTFFFLLLCSHSSFYLSQWEEQHTHVLRSNLLGIVGVTEIQWGNMVFLLTNSLCNAWWSDTLVSHYYPQMVDMSPTLANSSMIGLFGYFSVFATSMQIGFSFWNVWSTLGSRRFVKDSVPGVVPYFCWLAALVMTFQSEWGWSNPALATVILCPCYCLINSKLIVCNFTYIETPMIAYEALWFTLFPLNSMLGLNISEEVIAAIIFTVNTAIYFTFVYCTIEQITTFLDIYCLSIKPKRQLVTDILSTETSPASPKRKRRASPKKTTPATPTRTSPRKKSVKLE